MQRWVRGAPNGDNDADQTPPEDDLAAEDDVLGSTTGAAREGTVAGTGHEAEASGTLEADIDLGWLPEPGRTQALSGRAAAYDDTGRCAYHSPPYGCTLVDGDADGPGLTELCGLTPAKPASVPPETRPDAPTQLLDARPRSTPTGADASTEVRKRSANLMTWCERCATGIHIRCANDHAIGHGGDDCIGAYRAKDIAARSLLCLDCWTTHRPYVDESDEDEVERGDQPERHPNRLRWRWPGRLKELLDTAARRERAAHAELWATAARPATNEPRAGPGAQWQPPDHSNDRRSADAPARCAAGLAAHDSADDDLR